MGVLSSAVSIFFLPAVSQMYISDPMVDSTLPIGLIYHGKVSCFSIVFIAVNVVVTVFVVTFVICKALAEH